METETAAAAVQTAGFIHPVMADVMTILSLVLVVASVGVAAVAVYYAWRQTGGTIDVMEGHISWLRTEAERLSAAIQESADKGSAAADEAAALKEQIVQLETRIVQAEEQTERLAAQIANLQGGTAAPSPEPEPEPAPVSEPEPVPERQEEEIDLDALLESKPIWQDLLDDYHALRETFTPARGAELCQPVIDKDHLYALYKAFPRYETFGRLITERILQQSIDTSVSLASQKPEERFKHLMQTRAELFQRVPRKFIANLLGISPESLSRLQKRIYSKNKLLT